jgi:hypothetical protein
MVDHSLLGIRHGSAKRVPACLRDPTSKRLGVKVDFSFKLVRGQGRDEDVCKNLDWKLGSHFVKYLEVLSRS